MNQIEYNSYLRSQQGRAAQQMAAQQYGLGHQHAHSYGQQAQGVYGGSNQADYADALRYVQPFSSTVPIPGWEKTNPKIPTKGENMVTEIFKDAKMFIKEHKSTIYVIVGLLLIDHFVFQGAFKAKLKSLMDKLVGQVEEKLNVPKV